jgi:deazaflavin-dependent oxidoreductase (nitroreductase family)
MVESYALRRSAPTAEGSRARSCEADRIALFMSGAGRVLTIAPDPRYQKSMPEPFLYLTTRGRVSGLPRRIEIWFVEHDGKHYIVAEGREETGWVKNLKACPSVTFSVGPREAPASVVPETPATARTVDRAAFPELSAAVAKAMEAKYRWSDGLIVELAPVGPAEG